MANFRTRARAVDLLGKQQVRDEVTAISELLRNSYDAGANEGLVDVDTSLDRIIVWDDGEGMSLEDIHNNWLTIGTHSKNIDNQVTKKGRVKIGEKGIGRLAISTLGNQLLLISKKEFSNEWSILYLHWELFRNERIFLEDISVPTLSFQGSDELSFFLQNNFNDFKAELFKNLEEEKKWDSNIVKNVKQDIENFELTDDLLDYILVVEERTKGSLFYIKNLDDKSIWEAYQAKTGDTATEKRKIRLRDQLYSFQNYFTVFEENQNKELLNSNDRINNKLDDDGFSPNIIINGYDFSNETWFNEEDINLYDYSVKGIIENGHFYGNLFIRYDENRIETISVKEIRLTQGIRSPNKYDSGPIKVHWFFVEGLPSKTGLNKDQHKNITDKLNNIGGIYVFRDGLRILPYGEPGNDFLEIEARRTLRAGPNLFSHRRMFGYMEISKVTNKFLQDKSSREGFIENQYYNFFRSVAINLLKWWSNSFLESGKEDGRRDLRVKQIQQERQQREAQKVEEANFKNYLRELEKKVENFPVNIGIAQSNIKSELDGLLKQFNDINNAKELNNTKLNKEVFKIKATAIEAINKLEYQQIELNPRHPINYQIERIIHNYNIELDLIKEQLLKEFNIGFNNIEAQLQKKVNDRSSNSLTSHSSLIKDIEEEIDLLISQSRIEIPDLIKKTKNQTINSFNKQLNLLMNEFNKKVESNVNDHIKPINSINEELQMKANKLMSMREQINKLDSIEDNDKLIENTKNSIKDLESSVELLQNDLIGISTKLNNSISWALSLIDFINASLKHGESWNTHDNLIGLLKDEINMYRDLSAIGLAAELTSHEFNSLYSSIKQNLKTLHAYLETTDLIHFVRQTNKAFLSLERLNQRMSPLYRQSRAIRREFSLKEFIEDILEYFLSDIERYKIKPIIDISNDFVIKEAETILFTPIVNLLSNSIYWLIDHDTKEIHFYTENNCLYIHDTGPGIHAKNSTIIFKPYFTERENGRGLGLFLSRDILESKGHQLYLVPKEAALKPLSGACFCIELKKDIIQEGAF